MLQYLMESSSDILKSFYCGVSEMDDFIHNSLKDLLRDHPDYRLCVVKEDAQNEIVAMFVTSIGRFIDYDEGFFDVPCGTHFSSFDEHGQICTGTEYPSFEIDYLAVREDLRDHGYGGEIMGELSRRAQNERCYFLTVDAYHNIDYSAIGFYEKQGFFPLEEYSEEQDTLRMAKRVEFL